MRALISVYDKTGIVEFARKLAELNVEIISTGGTGKLFLENNIPFLPVEKVSKNKEAFGGRMKTISFEIMSSILFRRNEPQDLLEISELGMTPIDIVVCNLYDFNSAIEKNADLSKMIELIDVGGPTMIRSAAKNYKDVTCITDPNDYQEVADELLKNNLVSRTTNERLAIKAFTLTANYDLMISSELNKNILNKVEMNFSENKKSLRYGENPHQKASLYLLNNTNQFKTLANAEVLSGKEISYNNYLDSDSAFKLVSELKLAFPNDTHVVIVKHGIPCGVSSGKNLYSTLKTAWDCDSVSAFGGVISFSEIVTEDIAQFFDDKFVEVIIAPDFTNTAFEKLKTKKNLRLIKLDLKLENSFEKTIRSINGGILVQDEDQILAKKIKFKLVTKNDFLSEHEKVVLFGQTIIKYLKSNCLALVSIKDDQLFISASGVGQPNRIECLTKLIKDKIRKQDVSKDILFSDAFFPFADSIVAAHDLGINYIVQPGGSIKDKEVIAKCDELNISMKFSSVRNFRH
jgi:phosphoribosylaminoimidazolecarboxamide formyltransferase/IMP cyclohydrolase